jgi:site-specific DNA-methyltransferase (adenine-specific)
VDQNRRRARPDLPSARRGLGDECAAPPAAETLPAIPAASDLIRPDVARDLELDVRARVRGIEDVAALEAAATQMNALAKALAGTRLATYPRAAARRIEWQIGRLLGKPPGSGRRKVDPDQLSAVQDKTERSLFRLIGTLDLEWDALEPWAQDRAQLVRTARERRRDGSTEAPIIYRGDFAEALVDVEPGSVALILTDPPYALDALPLYDRLGAFAAEKLTRGGSLICYTGHATLPGALTALDAHLRYWWCLALEHNGRGRRLVRKRIRAQWKPVLWHVKDVSRPDRAYVDDLLQGTPPSKHLHEWAQGVDEVVPLIEALTAPGDLVCDPFAGSGSFGIAARKIGRRFVGADDR